MPRKGEQPREPRDRGRMLDAKTIATDLFGGTVGEQWVRRNVPGKIVFSHRLVRWWECDVLAWIEGQRLRD